MRNVTKLDHHTVQCCFDECFGLSYRVQMRGGAVEPLYEPADWPAPAQLWYREDFAASALHEAAHWCIAGDARREKVDFGYVYLPPPRDETQQLKFFELEIQTQALEALLAEAAGVDFQVSADNLQANAADFSRQVFKHMAHMRQWLDTKAGERARQFERALGDACKCQEAHSGSS